MRPPYNGFGALCTGKFRDPLGVEHIDEKVLGGGPREAPKKVNAMSPVASPRARSREGAASPTLGTPIAAQSAPVTSSA
jgi:hypothetical protein